METSIELLPGVKVVVDESKFDLQAALALKELPPGDWQVTFDLSLHNIAESTNQDVKSIVILRAK